MLGFMNQAAQECQYVIAMRGGLEHADIDALNHEQRRTLRNRNGYHQPIELSPPADAQRLSAYAIPSSAARAPGPVT
jgi:hypothetical protein